ncbi:MAG: chromosomal replication initiator DnaA [Caulobacteraceae bacterium]|nr:chromosomal replication initiator DnaA [Caulobacter sp.]
MHLGLATTPQHHRDDFVAAEADREAVARVDGHAAGALALVGPPGAGKTHLARAWAAARGAQALDARTGAVPESAGAVLVDGADAAGVSDALLFGLIEGAARLGRPLLLTGRTPPADWPVRLPDLRSRLNALPVAELSEPDEAALAHLLTVFFRERGVAPSPELVAYLVRRIERSAAAAREAVRRLDDAAHATGRPVGRGLAREVLEGRA